MRRWALTLVLALSACGETVNHQAATGCVPDCGGRACGLDGCGGLCGECATGQFCTSAGVCAEVCTPDCTGRECGPAQFPGRADTSVCAAVDCGPACPASAATCTAVGRCCAPDCAQAECGDDGCGGLCGTCTGTLACDGNLCR